VSQAPPPPARTLDLERFVRERRAGWRRFEALLGTVEALPEREIGSARLMELLRLYRQTCSDLTEARSYTVRPALLTRLNALVGRGYRFVYRRQHGSRTREAIRRFFSTEVPAVFQRERRYLLQAAVAFSLGAVFGLGAVLADARNAERLIPAAFFSESPRERVERIERSDERVDSLEEAAAFGAYLFSHNIKVSFLAFSLGALTIVGGFVLLFYNGVILGALAATYLLDGVHVFFLAWVGPHGALEIPAILMGAAAGLRLGRAFLMPGELTTAAALRRAFASVWRMLVTTALVLIVAGLIEGSFSQFSVQTVPYGVKITVAAAVFALLLGYLFGRRPGPEEAVS
jgi:uncharacterized membrane protein SpoIIM required for sporulation